jgi:hypothetical protein
MSNRYISRRNALLGGLTFAGLASLSVAISKFDTQNIASPAAASLVIPKPEIVPAKPPSFAIQKPSLTIMPAWFIADLQRHAQWLPQAILTRLPKDRNDIENSKAALDQVFEQRWDSFDAEVQKNLTDFHAPSWYIALMPEGDGFERDIRFQFRNMAHLAGNPAKSEIDNRINQLLLISGFGEIPTVGEKTSGVSLQTEGCTAEISQIILSQILIEFGDKLPGINPAMGTTQSSVELHKYFLAAEKLGYVTIQYVNFKDMDRNRLEPGDLTQAWKWNAPHFWGWAEVPVQWGYVFDDLQAIGNTGMSAFGSPHMKKNQEGISYNLLETWHYDHGLINTPTDWRKVPHDVAMRDPHNKFINPYDHPGTVFVIYRFNPLSPHP